MEKACNVPKVAVTHWFPRELTLMELSVQEAFRETPQDPDSRMGREKSQR